ncbi:MAG TPA: glycogen/starch synthase, partial [bacterium]|nr:glycogen/starch synthase [bacterium]
DRSRDLYGILNGIDYGEWNPATDKEIPAQYTPKNTDHKKEAKRLLLRETGLKFHERTPVIGLVSRLADQKGLDLIAGILNEMLAGDVQFVVQGLGDARYHTLFQELRDQFPDKFSLNLKFDNRLAKLIYAGSDLFLMPSRFEPCGLGQLIALKYGTVPVVRRTGGLADTIEDLSPDGKRGTGFMFEEYRTEALWATLQRALEAFHQPKIWKGLVQRGMTQDFSWDASAQRYLDLYRNIRFPA